MCKSKSKLRKIFYYDQKQKVGLLESYQTLYFGKSEGDMINDLKKSFFGGFDCLSLQIETTFSHNVKNVNTKIFNPIDFSITSVFSFKLQKQNFFHVRG